MAILSISPFIIGTRAVRKGDVVVSLDARLLCFHCDCHYLPGGYSESCACPRCNAVDHWCCGPSVEDLAQRFRVSAQRIITLVRDGELCTHRPDLKTTERSRVLELSIDAFVWNRSNVRVAGSLSRGHRATCEYCGRSFVSINRSRTTCPHPLISGLSSTCLSTRALSARRRQPDRFERDRRSQFMLKLQKSIGALNEHIGSNGGTQS